MSGSAPIWVVKVGGRELVPGPGLAALVVATAAATRAGHRVVLVHGGGDEVSARCEALGLAVDRVRGQRVTTEAVREVVAEVLAGRINVRVVNALESGGVPAVGLSGVSGRLIAVRPAGDPPGSLGWVGEPTHVNPRLLSDLLADGITPVVAPLGSDATGGVYNVNADVAAAAIAGALHADLVLLTDVPAVRGADARDLEMLTPVSIGRLVARGVAHDGMIPKLEAAAQALDRGARSVWVGDLGGWGPEGPKAGHGTTVRPDPRGAAAVHASFRTEQIPHARS